MSRPFELVHSVFDAFKGLPDKLADINSHSAELYRSHGRRPKTEDPTANGNVSPVTHYMRYVAQFEAVEPGSGSMLNNRVHAELCQRFRKNDELSDQGMLHCGLIDEFGDVSKCLAQKTMEKASTPELRQLEVDCDEAAESAMEIKAQARLLIKQREMAGRNGAVTRANVRLAS
jgi:hypothetical protein